MNDPGDDLLEVDFIDCEARLEDSRRQHATPENILKVDRHSCRSREIRMIS